jgi:acetyltransferase-like isoleucine patch superfamily enzyme
MTHQDSLAKDKYIRSQMFDEKRSTLRRYADIVVGDGESYWALLKYEIITLLFGGIPGALGLALRKIFFPSLFKRCGRGVVFGRDVVVRNGRHITLGDQVVVDDGCLLDGRGAGEEGVVIGDRVILNRDVLVQAKIGPVHIGSESDIGSGSIVHAQGGTYIGEGVVIGGGAKISGGRFQIELAPSAADAAAQADRGQGRWTRGPIRIRDHCLIGMGCIFLDGIEVGEQTIIGAGSLVNQDIPARAVAAGVPAKVIRMRR